MTHETYLVTVDRPKGVSVEAIRNHLRERLFRGSDTLRPAKVPVYLKAKVERASPTRVDKLREQFHY